MNENAFLWGQAQLKKWFIGCVIKGFTSKTAIIEKSPQTDLSHRRGQEVDYPVVGDGDDALAVDLDDAVSDAHPSALGDAAAEQTADLEEGEERRLN